MPRPCQYMHLQSQSLLAISKVCMIDLYKCKLEEVAKPKGKGPNFLEELRIDRVEVGLPPTEPFHTDQDFKFCSILWKPNQNKRIPKPRSTSIYIHLLSQTPFANLAEYCTVLQGLIGFSPITPSISATTCGSGGKLLSVRLLIDELIAKIWQLAIDKSGRIFETLAFGAMTLRTRISAHVVKNQESGKRYNLRSLSSCSGCCTGSWWLHWFCCKKSRELNPLNPISGLDHG